MYRNFLFLFLLIPRLLFAQSLTYRDSIDVHHYHIKLDLSDLSTGILFGETSLLLSYKFPDTKNFALDLQGLQVDKVLLNGKLPKFTYRNNVLRIFPDKRFKKNKELKITVFYHGKPQQDKIWGGFFITGNYAFNYGIGMDAIPPNFGRVWFPCIDNFTDRATYEYSIKIKKSYAAACPGILTEIEKKDEKTEIWYWKLEQSIPTYLSSVAVGNYSIYKDTVKGLKRNIPVEIFIDKHSFTEGKKSFVHLKDFLHAFENAYGSYVWDKIGYVSTPFKGGAMEHATNIAYSSDCNVGLSCENTLAHELSHHWFGNLVTCRSEKDMWLNEGWASYSEAIFREYFYGENDFKDYNRNRHKNVLQFAHLYDNGYLPLYGIPHKYTYGFTIYKKGADVAHALRGLLGDSLFFGSLKQYFIDYAFKDISVDEFRTYMSQQSGIDLTDFFDFWVYGAGFPHFSIDDINIEKSENRYNIALKIKQRLKAANNYLKTPLEIGIIDSTEKMHIFETRILNESKNFKLNLDFKPELILVDPNEKIPDATTDELRVIKQTGTQKFYAELFDLDVKNIYSDVYFAITHHWIEPEHKKLKAVFAKRYWTVQFTGNDLETDAKFYFDLSYALDNNLSKFGTGKLKLLYREKPTNDWKLINAKEVRQGRKSFFILEKLKKGEYTIAGF